MCQCVCVCVGSRVRITLQSEAHSSGVYFIDISDEIPLIRFAPLALVAHQPSNQAAPYARARDRLNNIKSECFGSARTTPSHLHT